jgi:hypothetical protein
VEWNNVNKTKSSVNYFALNLSNPKPIISFARNNNLIDKKPFRHLTQYCRSNTAVDIARIIKVSKSLAGIKYKFGIKSPEESRMRFLTRIQIQTTYHSSSSRQYILSTSYRRNTKVKNKQKSYIGFRRIDSSKLIYRLTINTI